MLTNVDLADNSVVFDWSREFIDMVLELEEKVITVLQIILYKITALIYFKDLRFTGTARKSFFQVEQGCIGHLAISDIHCREEWRESLLQKHNVASFVESNVQLKYA